MGASRHWSPTGVIRREAAEGEAQDRRQRRHRDHRRGDRGGWRRGGAGRWRGWCGSSARIVWSIFWRSTAVVTLIVALAVFYFYSTMPPIGQMLDGRIRGSVTMLDRDGKVFAWRGEQFGGRTTAASVSPNLKHAVVATEDKRFYHHFGVSPRGIASAIRINLAEGRGPLSGNGGSTITQQVAKLVCLGMPYDPGQVEDRGRLRGRLPARVRCGAR